jgi:hypothetical protein
MDENFKLGDLTVGEFRLLMREFLMHHELYMQYRKHTGTGVIGAINPYDTARQVPGSKYGQGI